MVHYGGLVLGFRELEEAFDEYDLIVDGQEWFENLDEEEVGEYFAWVLGDEEHSVHEIHLLLVAHEKENGEDAHILEHVVPAFKIWVEGAGFHPKDKFGAGDVADAFYHWFRYGALEHLA